MLIVYNSKIKGYWSHSRPKKKQVQGKRLNLLGEEDNGPQLFSPSRVKAAREFAAAKKKKDAEEKRKQQH